MKRLTSIAHAFEHLRRHNFEIIDRNIPRSLKDPRHSYVDLVAWDPDNHIIAFVEVIPHGKKMEYVRRLRSPSKVKRAEQRKAIRSWLRENKWRGAYRFDIIEVYGADENPNPVIDHIIDAKIFKRK